MFVVYFSNSAFALERASRSKPSDSSSGCSGPRKPIASKTSCRPAVGRIFDPNDLGDTLRPWLRKQSRHRPLLQKGTRIKDASADLKHQLAAKVPALTDALRFGRLAQGKYTRLWRAHDARRMQI